MKELTKKLIEMVEKKINFKQKLEEMTTKQPIAPVGLDKK